jgi:hypothetical protein
MNRAGALIAALMVLACSRERAPEAEAPKDSVSVDTIAPAWSVAPSPHNLECSPRVVGPNDDLRIKMGRPHGSSLFISGPDRTPFIVVFHPGSDRGARQSLMTPERFKELDEIGLKVSSFKAGVWVFGRDTNETVFAKPGTYRIRVGDDMETDGPSYAECLVTYRPQ